MTSPIERLVNQLARLNLRNLSPMQVNQTKKRKRTSSTLRRSPGKAVKKAKRG